MHPRTLSLLSHRGCGQYYVATGSSLDRHGFYYQGASVLRTACQKGGERVDGQSACIVE